MCNGWAMARAKADAMHKKYEGEYLESLGKEEKVVTYDEIAKSNCDELENIYGDHALIFYYDDSYENCYGWLIFDEDGTPHKFHACTNSDEAFRKLSRLGFRY